MNNQYKPRICEVLGVEVGERFQISPTGPEYYINKYAELVCISSGFHLRCDGIPQDIINHPDHIIRKPQFTEEEIGVKEPSISKTPNTFI